MIKWYIFNVVIFYNKKMLVSTVSATTYEEAVEMALWQNGFEVKDVVFICRPVDTMCVFNAIITKDSYRHIQDHEIAVISSQIGEK